MPMLVSMVGLVIVMVGIAGSLGKLVVEGVSTLVVNVGFADVGGGAAPFSRCFSITSLQAKVIKIFYASITIVIIIIKIHL